MKERSGVEQLGPEGVEKEVNPQPGSTEATFAAIQGTKGKGQSERVRNRENARTEKEDRSMKKKDACQSLFLSRGGKENGGTGNQFAGGGVVANSEPSVGEGGKRSGDKSHPFRKVTGPKVLP